MHQHIAMDWADRLESGKYPQGKGALCEYGRFCCLGVLSDMAVEAGIATKTRLEYSDDAYRYEDVEPSTERCTCCADGEMRKDSSTGILTRNIQAWAGMTSASGSLAVNHLIGSFGALTTANDGGTPFQGIAQYIRENYETL